MLFCSLLVSCDLMDPPEYPDKDFSIVGTWEYYIPPCTGTAPGDGDIYNAVGYITFTDDYRFSFVINSDNGEVKGYGTYVFNEDTGISLNYDSYKELQDLANKEGYIKGFVGYSDGINWGKWGDRVEDDYMLVHSGPVKEYKRVESRAFEDTVIFYRSPDAALDDDWNPVLHSGRGSMKFPNEFVIDYLGNN